MIRRIIRIDEEKCTGCGLCAKACHEGAIDIVDGKAKVARENFCDGFGDCLPACPVDAISFETREAPRYDEAAVMMAKLTKAAEASGSFGCPGSRIQTEERKGSSSHEGKVASELRQWPVEIQLLPVKAPFFDQADLLVAADCTAFAYGDFHRTFLKGRTVLVGCSKLDGTDYTEKLAAIFGGNAIKSVTVIRMEVPCCGGLERMVQTALGRCGKKVPLRVVIISNEGEILEDRT